MPFVLLVQRILLATLFRHRGVAMHVLQAQIAGVGHGVGVGMESDARLLEHSEIMPAACARQMIVPVALSTTSWVFSVWRFFFPE